jgi:hypothetical protein
VIPEDGFAYALLDGDGCESTQWSCQQNHGVFGYSSWNWQWYQSDDEVVATAALPGGVASTAQTPLPFPPGPL